MSLVNASHHPPVTASPDATVMQACELMLEHEMGAVALVDTSGVLRGIFTERDVMKKVVAHRLDPEKTSLREVMTSPCFTIPNDRSVTDAIALMVAMKINHLAVVGPENQLLGMLSYRSLLKQRLEIMDSQVDSLTAYAGQDGIGGD